MPDGEEEKAEAKVHLDRVKNVGASIVDIDDGRTLAPGDYADDVNLAVPHNDRLVLAGIIVGVPTHSKKEKG